MPKYKEIDINNSHPTRESKFTRQPIYGNFSLILIGFMFVTLLPHYGKVLSSDQVVTFQFILHAILYLGWYVLFAVQSRLSLNKNIHLHMTLGYMSIFLFCGLIFSGAIMLIDVMRNYDSTWTAEFLRSRTSFVWAIIHTLISFASFYLLGVVLRKKLHAHKRFMVLASLSMVSASVTRVAFLPIMPIDGTLLTLLSTYVFLLVPIIIDRVVFGRVHPVLKWGVPLYAVTQILFIGLIPSTEIGQLMAFPF